ncbi:hypothetical protein [Azospirillum soli]|uniref:hypothetical protein n=1 Tax=Azospirillum soli TaxID=1304799 RepID=UPI001AEB45B9|nr:hypothetical protein [Azospirillum soli]MBP2311278.1 hypothetical protein [Azospirillum soli]
MANEGVQTETTNKHATRVMIGTLAVVLGAVVLGGLSPARAQDAPLATLPQKCEQAATERLSAMGLANAVTRGMPSEIRSGVTIPSGYRARYYNPNCGGYVVMNFDSMCGYEQTYTTGNCRMQGMPHWW